MQTNSKAQAPLKPKPPRRKPEIPTLNAVLRFIRLTPRGDERNRVLALINEVNRYQPTNEPNISRLEQLVDRLQCLSAEYNDFIRDNTAFDTLRWMARKRPAELEAALIGCEALPAYDATAPVVNLRDFIAQKGARHA